MAARAMERASGLAAGLEDVSRSARHILYKGMRFASHHPRGASKRDFLWFVPSVRSRAELADLSARVNWYLPDLTVPIYVDAATSMAFGPEDAPHMDPKLVYPPPWADQRPLGRPEFVYWHMEGGLAAHFIRNARRAELVDWQLFRIPDEAWTRLLSRYGQPTPSHQPALERLLGKRAAGASVFVLGTGPSASLVNPQLVTADIRIVCNSAVRNHELLRELQPDLIAFADSVFHYSPNRYAAAFRSDLMKALHDTNALMLTQDHQASVLLAHEPRLADRLVVLTPKKGGDWRWPEHGRTDVRRTGNVLTKIMLPVAFALGEEVQIAGCDGRRPDETYFWRHNKSLQYTDELMAAASAAHPGFFRDASYRGQYDEHCAEIASLLDAAEARGKRVKPVTPSWIPALRDRGAPPFPDEP